MKLEIIHWGTFDRENSEFKNLVEGTKKNKYKYKIFNVNIWSKTKQKYNLGFLKLILLTLKSIFAYPYLICCLIFKIKKTNNVLMTHYPAIIDLIIISFLKKIKIFNGLIYANLFISIYDTLIFDRALIKNKLLKKIIYSIESFAFKKADRLIIDSKAHLSYLSKIYKISPSKFIVNYLCANENVFNISKIKKKSSKNNYYSSNKINILYYGKYVPLHGVMRLNEILSSNKYFFTFVGEGQDFDRFYKKYKNYQNIKFLPFLKQSILINYIYHCDYVLGIFSNSKKANNVIPNKIFEALLLNKTIITKKTSAIIELKKMGFKSRLILIDKISDKILNQKIMIHSNRKKSWMNDTALNKIKTKNKTKLIYKNIKCDLKMSI